MIKFFYLLGKNFILEEEKLAAIPRTILTSTQWGIAFQPRTGIAVTGYIAYGKRVPVDVGALGVLYSELMRRHGGEVRTVWYRTTVTVEYETDEGTKKETDLVRIGFYGTKTQVLGTNSVVILSAIKMILDKVSYDQTVLATTGIPQIPAERTQTVPY